MSWAYFAGGVLCRRPQNTFAECEKEGPARPQNVLTAFADVKETGQLDNIRPHSQFFRELREGTLPSVWIVPGRGGKSEHPLTRAPITRGQAYVTKLINAVMRAAPALAETDASASRSIMIAGPITTPITET